MPFAVTMVRDRRVRARAFDALIGRGQPWTPVVMVASFGRVVTRWRALAPDPRRRLVRHLAKSLVICAVLYAALALSDHSWWRPAVGIALIGASTAVVRRVQRALRR